MRQVLAIARLTFWEGIRMRIVLVFLVVLIFVVLRLPFALRGDDTLAGRLQTFLYYSLSALSVFLSLATVFLACSTLATEIRNYSIHMVVTKPVPRFTILLGKWLGVNALAVLLVVLCGAAIYGFAVFIKNQPEEFRRDRLKIDDVVWTARVAARPTKPDFQAIAREAVRQRIAEGAIPQEREAVAIAERMKEEESRWRAVPPETGIRYEFSNLLPPERPDAVVQIRFKARGIPIPPDEVLHIVWDFLDPESDASLVDGPPFATSKRSGDLHQFLVQAAPLIRNGKVSVLVINPVPLTGRTTIHLEGEDSLQILYQVSSFELNYIKTLLMILLRLAFLSAVGLTFSTFVSFPIACLCAFSVYLIGLGWTWWWEAIGANIQMRTDDVDPYGRWGPLVRLLLEPILYAFPDLARYDGARLLIDGEYISYTLLGQCAAHTLAFGTFLLLGVGWGVFRRREIAEVTV